MVLCDTSPLIFLACLDRLSLIGELLAGPVLVLDCVQRELLSKPSDPIAADRLAGFLSETQPIIHRDVQRSSRSLSECDQATLSWAIAHHPEWLLADERLLRRVAQEHGIRVIGTCGLLVQASKRGFLTRDQVRSDIDRAVDMFHMRISIPLYREILAALE